jgi:hypothetical protein
VKQGKSQRTRAKPNVVRELRHLIRLAMKGDRKAARRLEPFLKPLPVDELFRAAMKQAGEDLQKALEQKSKEAPTKSAAHLYLRTNGCLRGLLLLAGKGDREAATYMLSLLTDTIERFLNICSKDAKLAADIRFPSEPWPLLHTQLEVNQEGYLTVPSNHPLRKLGIVRKGRSFSEGALGTRIAMQLCRKMDFNRRITPDSRENVVCRIVPVEGAEKGEVNVVVKRKRQGSHAKAGRATKTRPHMRRCSP